VSTFQVGSETKPKRVRRGSAAIKQGPAKAAGLRTRLCTRSLVTSMLAPRHRNVWRRAYAIPVQAKAEGRGAAVQRDPAVEEFQESRIDSRFRLAFHQWSRPGHRRAHDIDAPD